MRAGTGIEEQFRILADSAPVMIWRAGPDKLCDYFNRPWLEFTGRTLEQELGYGWAEGIHPDDLQACRTSYDEALTAHKPFNMNYRLRRHDGVYRWILDKGAPFFQAGEFAGYFGSCIDITESKEIETQLRTAIADRELLLNEIQHRTRNNLQLVVSLLRLQREEISDVKARKNLDQAMSRIHSMALVQDHISRSDPTGQVDFIGYLRSLSSVLANLHDVQIVFDPPSLPIQLPLSRAAPAGLAIHELINLSLRQVPLSQTQRILSLSLDSQADALDVIIEYSNPGNAKAKSLDTSSLSFRLLHDLARQARGIIDIGQPSPTSNRLRMR